MSDFFVNFANPMKSLYVSIIIIIMLVFIPLPDLSADNNEKIIKIDVMGYERIDRGFILNNITTKENEPYDLEKLRDDMKRIYKTGFFSDVQIDVKDTDKGKIVTFVVIERPPIKAIYVDGNKKIKTGDIRDKLKIKTGSVLNIEKVKESLDEIKKLYTGEGYYAVKVSYSLDFEEEYDLVVKFSIEEPEKAFVRKISFTGNKTFTASKLKKYMRTREKGIFSWFTGSGILDEEALEDDRKNIEAFYSDNGYVKANVGVPEIQISKDGKSISIMLPVTEGNLYKVGTIDFTGDLIFSIDEITKNLKSKQGNTFRASLYQEDILMITDLYQNKGYAFCDIAPLTSIDDESLKVNIVFNITKGQEIYVNHINIFGNIRTRDKVIRRELKIAEGDRFSSEKLKDSKKRLKNTTYFKETDLKIVKTDEPDKVNLDITVEENPTGKLSVGLGYGSYENAIVSGSISQENFLGTGRKLFLEAAISGVYHEFRFTYIEPYIVDKNIDAVISLLNLTRIMDTYDYKTSGGTAALIRRLTDDVKGSIKFRHEKINVKNIEETASIYVKEQEGTKTTNSIMTALTKNTIDDILNPTKGVNSEVSFELAGGPFSGDNYFYRAIAYYGRYFPLKFADSAFFLRGTIGAIRTFGNKKLPIYEKFYVGGIDTVRGFKYGEAGPTDSEGEVIGAKNQLYFNTEWIFPIYKPAGLKGVVFYDFGSAFDDNKGFMLNGLRHGAGFGIRWFSPMGPIRIELGFNLFPKKDERRQVFDFSMGTQY